MCRRNRSRPSSKRRLTKKVKRLSSACSGFDSAMGVVEEHKLSTNGPAAPCGLACSTASWRAVAPDAELGVGVIESSPDRCVNRPPVAEEEFPDEIGVRASRQVRDRGSPAVIEILPLDRWLCVPVFRRVCPCHYKLQVSKRRG